MSNPSNEYDVSQYTDDELYRILSLLPNPTDRELEAKILSMIRKYSQYGNATGDKLAQFYIDIYQHFFETDVADAASAAAAADTQAPEPSTPLNATAQAAQVTADTSFTASKQTDTGNVQLTKPLDYAKDKLNPLLKQSVKRIISIDSQYRENKSGASTQFTFNLSEPLKDVVALSLYSVQIPYTWYTINGNFGGNFIYIKGYSAGINNGNHDYKIQIPSGNYTPDGLVAKVNDSIQKMAALNTTVSFGKTSVIFNDGIASSVGGTAKAKFLVDITNIYGEGNYYLQFANWTSPAVTVIVNEDTTTSIVTNRLKSIAGFLGFNAAFNRTTGIYSNYLTGFSSGNSKTDEFTISAETAYFDILPYLTSPLTDSSFTPIRVSLWDTTTASDTIVATREELLVRMDTVLKSNSFLDPNFSYCQWVDLSGQDVDGFNQFNFGNSYIEIHCKLNKATAPIVANLKLAARFPNAAANTFFSDTSCFKIIPSYFDSSQNAIVELNNVLADTSLLQSNYPIEGTNQIHFVCTATGYTVPKNSFIADLAPNIIGYTLEEYLSQINVALRTVPELRGTLTGTSTTSMYIDRTGYVYLQTYLRKSFTTSQYQILGQGQNIPSIFNLPLNYTDLGTSNNVFSNPSYPFRGVFFSEDSGDFIRIQPRVSNNSANYVGNESAGEFVIPFVSDARYNSVLELEQFLNTTITTYTDNAGRRPLSNSKVEYVAGSGFVLTVNVQITLTQNDYNVQFVSTDPSNTWVQNLFFKNTTTNSATYDLLLYSQNNGAFSLVRNNNTISNNQIILQDGSDNSFTVLPYATIDGLQTTNNQYAVKVTVPPGTYSVVTLLESINGQLTANPITNGSRFETVTVRGQLYVQMRWNINQIFTTKDYQLVFYDPISFVSCYAGASSSGSQSIQNATWDTTLGWILGFRNHITYNLADYVQNVYYLDIPDLEYYLTGADSNVFTLQGDTAVTTNLYNYFLIVLDDYVQNHLNDGLVTITSQDTVINHAPAIFVCDPATGQQIARPADYGSPGVTYTDKQLYSFNQQVQSNAVKNRSYSKGPFVQDVFGIIPIKPGTINTTYIEFGGTLQNQQRVYFGPVNIHRMTIRLLNDRGDLVDLNNANWGFSLICEQLYKN